MENIDVLCINCENMISLEKISIHSTICMAPTQYVLKLSHTNPLKMLDFKLDKLKCSIESILQEKNKPLTTDEKMIFTYIVRYSGEVLGVKEPVRENVEKCQKIAEEINRFPLDFISPCVVIYVERVKMIAIEKGHAIENECQKVEANMSLGSILESRASQLEGLKKQILKFKQATGDLDTRAECLEINSVVDDIGSKRSLGSSIMSPKEGLRLCEIDELDNMFIEQEKVNKERSNADLQKYFYSKCLVMKLGFSSRDPAQFIQIPDLYRRVRETCLPVEKWEDFIKEQFKNPEIWVKKK